MFGALAPQRLAFAFFIIISRTGWDEGVFKGASEACDGIQVHTGASKRFFTHIIRAYKASGCSGMHYAHRALSRASTLSPWQVLPLSCHLGITISTMSRTLGGFSAHSTEKRASVPKVEGAELSCAGDGRDRTETATFLIGQVLVCACMRGHVCSVAA